MRRPLLTTPRRNHRRRIRLAHSPRRPPSLIRPQHQQSLRRGGPSTSPRLPRETKTRTKAHEAIPLGHGRPRNIQEHHAQLLPRRLRRLTRLRHFAQKHLSLRNFLAARPPSNRRRRHRRRPRRQQIRSRALVHRLRLRSRRKQAPGLVRRGRGVVQSKWRHAVCGDERQERRRRRKSVSRGGGKDISEY